MRQVAASSKGYEKVGLFWEAGSSGSDYADFFRDAAQQLGLDDRRAR